LESVPEVFMLFGRKKDKHGLYYLLPGMTRANRVKRKKIFFWSLLVGILVAAVMGAIIWLANRTPHP